MKIKTQYGRGLTMVEVLLAVAAIILLLLLLLPSAPHRRDQAQVRRHACLNNVKQIGLAAWLWANDRADQFPQVSTNSEGSLVWANSPQVFRHFQVMSNELVTPKILVCPSDLERKQAADFVKLSNANLSYFVALDVDVSKPQRLLNGDRNITGGSLSNGFLRTLTSNTLAGWTAELHNEQGNVGLSDGSVEQMTGKSLQRQLELGDLPIIRLTIP